MGTEFVSDTPYVFRAFPEKTDNDNLEESIEMRHAGQSFGQRPVTIRRVISG